ncbi:hypothetical protein KL918_002827 [Ogataea parapolymorpha]|uniref:Mannosyltransferase KTR4 n=1 Tax=Ogataea parapolymorpha (strain ATCC 26012 / BCRC 20466 / JCM 22074 / NRRL Y-7560 / DL-1) TaxID=871575 RepID=W1QGH6_OGAPD|nr:mannosyltransferase KTR4 [Ogataea parapolymorpha DL-1]ESX01188.1 mannosyltransferase KTR4 [Ogataea parapolymorpha DL-1]KAG7867388.1 hypothetical protein KL918_002827 [Ogataea parapolymorpha]KAG7871774.1 hypothetical protein KL916_003624 [Ogataea parapolymorpha]
MLLNKRFIRLSAGIVALVFILGLTLHAARETQTLKGASQMFDSYRTDLQGYITKTASKYKKMTAKEVKQALTFKHGAFPEGTPKETIVEEQMKFHREVLSKKIDEPKGMKLVHKQDGDTNYELANATLLSLVRNSELDGIVSSIRQLEETWNWRYNYPFTFINDEEFTPEFKKRVEEVCSGKVYYEIIPKSIWEKPANIDPVLYKNGIAKLTENKVNYASLESYHNMCRFNSGWFYRLEGLKKFKYYWRVEPNVDFFCKVDYDVFKFMRDNELTYGFTVSLYDEPLTIETLWKTTVDFCLAHPEYVHPNGAFKWLTENQQNPQNTNGAGGYSTCHFWSNFEIADMDFYRGEAYSKWFDALEAAGGFYYERWGDAPVHSVGVGLFEDKSKVWWFRDIGYHHSPYENSPNSDKCSTDHEPGYFAPPDVYDQNCLPNWIKYSMTPNQLNMY